jgi:putative protease
MAIKKYELLAPAGNWEMLTAAVEAGADSVYLGVKTLNMRVNAGNFEIDELPKITEFCHKHKVKAYLALNTIIYNEELGKAEEILKKAKKASVDAVICWDPAVIVLARKQGLVIHISTQASVSNMSAVRHYHKLGAKRIVLARELSLAQIKKITEQIAKEKLDIEIETFIHGAMCVAVSGRCFTSQFLFKRSANRGDCLQPCRREYKVTDTETGDELKLDNNYVMSAKDLCALPFIDKLTDAGIRAFKIEGRCRSPEYVKTVVEVYKTALSKKLNESEKKELLDRLNTVYNRKFSSGFYLGLPTNDDFTDIYGSNATVKKEYVGYVNDYFKKVDAAEIYIETGKIAIGDNMMITGPTTGVKEQKITSLEIDHKKIKQATTGQSIAVSIDFLVRKNDRVYIMKSNIKKDKQ